jgi:8-oxo-dGTP pyrophosphatase MutT (NUDIX family)
MATIDRKRRKPAPKPALRIQYGALPYRFTQAAALEVLVVTTRQAKRWIIPKGWPIKRRTPAGSAAREAFEEAGVRGKIGAKSIGRFRYTKPSGNGAEPDYDVKVFPLLVKKQAVSWPESKQRVVRWVDPETAVSLIGEPELKVLVAAFTKKMSAAANKLAL